MARGWISPDGVVDFLDEEDHYDPELLESLGFKSNQDPTDKGWVRFWEAGNDLHVEGKAMAIEHLKFGIIDAVQEPIDEVWMDIITSKGFVPVRISLDEFKDTDISDLREVRALGKGIVTGTRLMSRGKGWWGQSWRHRLAARMGKRKGLPFRQLK